MHLWTAWFQPAYSNILASPVAGQCNSLTVDLCIAPPTISCESRSNEDKNKDEIINIKINNFIIFSEYLKMSLFFVASGLPLAKNITDYSDRVFGFQPLPSPL